jgi:hypothetical protein
MGIPQMRHRLQKEVDVVLEQPERHVAFEAEQAAHGAGRVTMIDAEPSLRRPFAELAGAVLPLPHGDVVIP